jgi:hypothetical protein
LILLTGPPRKAVQAEQVAVLCLEDMLFGGVAEQAA